MSFCKGCNAKIEWHKTAAGKSIPLDPDPVPNGNITFDAALRVVYAKPGTKPKMYLSHFVTCPKADAFRKKRPSLCDREGCELTTEHRHCFTCGGTDHIASACEAET